MIHDLSRVLVAQQTHRRCIDPAYLAKRVTPFAIIRPTPSPAPVDASASAGPSAAPMPKEDGMAQHTTIDGADRGKGTKR